MKGEGGKFVHEHRWQPGPLIEGKGIHFTGDTSTPMTVVLVCPCGEMRRVPVPWQIVYADGKKYP